MKKSMNSGFYVNRANKKRHRYDKDGNYFEPKDILAAALQTNKAVAKIFQVSKKVANIDLLEVIDKKQTGQFIGSIFVQKTSETVSNLKKNPSQTGSPDLIPSKHYPKNKNWDQGFFDQFPHGGVEAKTSMGSPKSGITRTLPVGEPRIEYLTSVQWKGHHTKINHLLGLFWDYVNKYPTILAGFYANNLVPSDFTYTDQKTGGGNTTNVAITKNTAIRKMGKGWVFCSKDERYAKFFSRKMGVVFS